MTDRRCQEVYKVVRQFCGRLTSAIYTTGVYYTPNIITETPPWALKLGYGITSFEHRDNALDFYFQNGDNNYFDDGDSNFRYLKVYKSFAIDVLPLVRNRVYPADMAITERILTNAATFDTELYIDIPRPWPKGTIMSQSLVLLEQINPNN